MVVLKPDVFDTLKDVFDEIDVFDNFADTVLKEYVEPPRVKVQIDDKIKALLKTQVLSEIETLRKTLKPEKAETKIIEKTVTQPTRVIVKELVDNSASVLKQTEQRIKKALDDYEKSGRGMYPVVVPNSIADQTGNGGKVLSTDGRTTKWIAAASSSGGTSTDAYTVTNNVTLKTYDSLNTSIDELARVLGSLITSLQGAGIIQ